MVLRLYDPFDSMMALGKDPGKKEESTSASRLLSAILEKNC